MSASHPPVDAVWPGDPIAGAGRVVIVSNRLPVTAQIERGEVRLQRSNGGLASGLRFVHERSRGLWIGWSGLIHGALPGAHRAVTHRLRDAGALPVRVSEEEAAGYYRGYSNGALWPVLHDRLRRPVATPRDWDLYRTVNERYAEVVAEQLLPGDRVWVHDYHLMLLPRLVRSRCPGTKIGFFLHTPFPPSESFASLPQAAELLDGVLGADLIGFHTRDYGRHFISTVRLVLGYEGAGEEGRAAPHQARVFACPMGVDVSFFARWARKPAVLAQARRIKGEGEGPLFLGVDRLDYTKGIPERLRAFERLLEIDPTLHRQARLIQIAVPSREDSGGYSETKRMVETLVRRINRRFGEPGWTPVEYRYCSVDTATLVALYRAADVMLVTPRRDGMNLVAKEFVACREDGDGVLVLSSRAGAAAELHAAVLTDPQDPEQLVRAYQVALEMSPAERRVRMRHLRQAVESHDVFQWSRGFLDALGPAPRSSKASVQF
jgi:trehalose 6-phosphate synthase/phosphatase